MPVDTYSTAGSFTWNSGASTSVDVVVTAAGGGGGEGDGGSAGGGGGGGGACSQTLSLAITPYTDYTVNVGDPGSGGIFGGAAATAGGDSWFGSAATVMAKGGGAGSNITAGTGGASGSGVGTTKFSGGNGANGNGGFPTGGGGGGSASNSAGGSNAVTTTGGAGQGAGGNQLTAGSAPGGGGGGGGVANGAAGAAGKVVLTTAVAEVPLPLNDYDGTGFRNFSEYADSLANNGKVHSCTFRKVPSQATTANIWADLSMAGGNPSPNYYVGSVLAATVFEGHRGIFHGYDKSPSSKYLVELGLTSPTAGFVGQYKLLDYVMFYPFIDMDSADEQVMDNTTTLPRYTDGAGLQVMAVAVTPSVGSGTFSFTYYNQYGLLKTSPVQTCNTTAANIATLITSQPAAAVTHGPFLRLADGDFGVRSIVSLTNVTLNGGLIALVLVRPICDSVIREVNTTRELCFPQFNSVPPRIVDGAYLNLIVLPAATIAAGTLLGQAKFIWN